MKWILTIIVTSVISFFALFKTKSSASKEAAQFYPKSFAVLELFTSEGCSSCPPADRLLPELLRNDSNIIALSFHVDYWDNLGWKDAFSNNSFTERQRRYGEQFHLESIYTPQLVINGEYETVGSNRQKAENLIKKVEEEPSSAEIKIIEVKKQNQSLSVTCHLYGEIKNSQLIAAIVQKHAERKIAGGENSGATLQHTNVVHSLVENGAKTEMNIKINLPSELKDGEWQLALYLQRQSDLKITAAKVYSSK